METENGNGKRSEWETKQGLVARAELIPAVPKLMAGLNDQQFHAIYSIIWSMSANNLLLEIKDKEIEYSKQKTKSSDKEWYEGVV